MVEKDSQSARRREAAQRTADGVFAAWEKRTQLVKDETAAHSAANDAKTARLRALRLEKEKQDADEAAAGTPAQTTAATPAKKAAKIRRITIT
ncbi:MAG TPA: hypothetical protein VGM26_10265 [Rhizomicrobium sp.]|jgi:hypothetical protein